MVQQRKSQRKKGDPIAYDWLYEHRIEKRWTLQQIADKLNVTRERVRQILLQAGIGKPDSLDYFSKNTGNIDTCNTTIFNTIDTEAKAYWLGFLNSKSRIHEVANGRRYLSFYFTEARKERFDALMAFLEAETFQTKHLHRPKESWSNMLIYQLNSHDFCLNLERHGIPISERMTAGFSPFVPEELLKHYLRGYYDNRDSLVQIESKYSAFVFSIYGSQAFLEDWVSYMNSRLSASYAKKSLRPGDGPDHYPRLMTRNKTIIQEIALHLYGEATIYDPTVAAKFDVFFEHLEAKGESN